MRIFNKFLFILLLIIIFPKNIYATEANFYLSPANGNFAVGEIFSISVNLSTSENINAAAATLDYPKEFLHLESISTAGSIFNLWPAEPKQQKNRIIFTGGLPNPGFNGDSGRMITLTFRVKKSGTAKINFVNGSMHINNGVGTNILSNMIGGIYTLLPQSITPDLADTVTPSKPIIKSITHPDNNIWYQNNNLKLEWLVSGEVEQISYELDKNRFTIPQNYSQIKTKQEYDNLADGIYYFHLRFKNQAGFSETAHFRINIDSTSPNPFNITIIPDYKKLIEPTIKYQTTDNLSGIDHYEIIKGTAEAIIVKESEYQFKKMTPGNYEVIVTAVDRAGNKFQATKNININTLNTPIIKEYKILSDDNKQFYLNGSADKNIKIKIFIQTNGKEFFDSIIQSDSFGNFIYFYENELPPGKYSITAQAFDENGNFSQVSEPINLEIKRVDYLFFNRIYLNYVLIGGTLLILLLLLSLFPLWFWRRNKNNKEEINQEMAELQQSIDFGFATLRRDILTELDELTIKKRQEQITQDEKERLHKLKIDLEVIEGYIKKELRDVENLHK